MDGPVCVHFPVPATQLCCFGTILYAFSYLLAELGIKIMTPTSQSYFKVKYL